MHRMSTPALIPLTVEPSTDQPTTTPLCQIPLHHLAHIHKGSLTDKQQLPEWDLVSTVGLSLLAAPRSDPDRLSPEAAERARRTPEGVEGEFELAVGPVRAIYKVRSSFRLCFPPCLSPLVPRPPRPFLADLTLIPWYALSNPVFLRAHVWQATTQPTTTLPQRSPSSPRRNRSRRATRLSRRPTIGRL